MVFFHAGPRGLRAILPPTETGARSSSSYGADRVCRRDRVYVTTDYPSAVGFASLVPGGGTVYEVDPVNPVHDPDCFVPGLSFEAERATIVRELRPKGKVLKMARKAMLAM